MSFQPAQRKQAKLKILLTGVAGAGKTWTALLIAFLLRAFLAIKGRVAFMDSEHESALKYARGSGAEREGAWDFDHCPLDETNPNAYVLKIREAREAGYEILCVDSLSHSWRSAMNLIDQGGGWGKAGRVVTPQLEDLTNSILRYPGHVICTARSKPEIAIEKDERTGKTSIKKLGLSPILRDGTDHDFDFVLDLGLEGMITVTKSRCPALPIGAVFSRADLPKMIERVAVWLGEGAPESQVDRVLTLIAGAATSPALAAVMPEIGKLTIEEKKRVHPLYVARKGEIESGAL